MINHITMLKIILVLHALANIHYSILNITDVFHVAQIVIIMPRAEFV
jgi:hypothetical protein